MSQILLLDVAATTAPKVKDSVAMSVALEPTST
jgi:hypothetical protein